MSCRKVDKSNKLIQLCILEMKTLLKEDIQNEIVYTFYK